MKQWCMKCGTETEHYIGKCSICGTTIKYDNSTKSKTVINENEIKEREVFYSGILQNQALKENIDYLKLAKKNPPISFRQQLICASLSGLRANPNSVTNWNGSYTAGEIAIKDADAIITILEKEERDK